MLVLVLEGVSAPGFEINPQTFVHVMGRIRSHAPLQIFEDEDDDEDENEKGEALRMSYGLSLKSP